MCSYTAVVLCLLTAAVVCLHTAVLICLHTTVVLCLLHAGGGDIWMFSPDDTHLYRSVHFSIQEQLLRINIKRFRGGLVFKAHRLVYHSTLVLRVIKNKRTARHLEVLS